MGDSPNEEEKVDKSFKFYRERRPNNSEKSSWKNLFEYNNNNEYYRLECESNVVKAFKEINIPKARHHSEDTGTVYCINPSKNYCWRCCRRNAKKKIYIGYWSLLMFLKATVFAIFLDPLLKILKGALKNAGCPFSLKRNVVCEDCSEYVQGGFDFEYQQIVVCKNNRKAKKHPDAILLHELIHMYDACVNKVDFKNLEHLACTEIRAANLAHCSFLSSLLIGQSSPINIKKTHQYCVKMKASQSLMAARDIDFPTAVKYITKVFDRCYNDLEPIGRRIRRNSDHAYLAYEEARRFKICDP